MKLLKKGSKGKDVEAMQIYLMGLGLYNGAVDGDFGPKTTASVVLFQKLKGLTADGIVGNLTMGAMLSDGMLLMPTQDNAPTGTFPPGFPTRPAGVNPLGSAGADAVFGKYSYVSAPVSGNPEAIRITDGWESKNIRLVPIPQLKQLGLSATGNARMHRLVVSQTLALWQAWEDAGLLDRVLSWEGMYVPRYIRGSRSTLSNHAKGSAFDINAGTNGLGRVPAALGTKGCVRELVPLAVEHGFYWGGWFSRGDGMHFEVRKVMEF
jgi:hypothetical protein